MRFIIIHKEVLFLSKSLVWMMYLRGCKNYDVGWWLSDIYEINRLYEMSFYYFSQFAYRWSFEFS